MRVDEHIFDNVLRMPLYEAVKCEMAAPSTRCVKKRTLCKEAGALTRTPGVTPLRAAIGAAWDLHICGGEIRSLKATCRVPSRSQAGRKTDQW